MIGLHVKEGEVTKAIYGMVSPGLNNLNTMAQRD